MDRAMAPNDLNVQRSRVQRRRASAVHRNARLAGDPLTQGTPTPTSRSVCTRNLRRVALSEDALVKHLPQLKALLVRERSWQRALMLISGSFSESELRGTSRWRAAGPWSAFGTTRSKDPRGLASGPPDSVRVRAPSAVSLVTTGG